jgi:hypothetical protein
MLLVPAATLTPNTIVNYLKTNWMSKKLKENGLAQNVPVNLEGV